MKKNPLHAAEQVFESQKNQAAREMGQAQQQVQKHKAQLQSLRDYEREYQQGLSTRAGLNAAFFHRHHLFMRQLQQAIEQQKAVIEQSEALYEQKRQHWLMRHNKTRAVQNLQQRHHDRLRKDEEKKEQKQQDDLVLQNRRHRPEKS